MRVFVNSLERKNVITLVSDYNGLDVAPVISGVMPVVITDERTLVSMSRAKTPQAFPQMSIAETLLKHLRAEYPDALDLLVAMIYHEYAGRNKNTTANALEMSSVQLWRWENNSPLLAALFKPDVWSKLRALLDAEIERVNTERAQDATNPNPRPKRRRKAA